jgi:Tol biopolymer transport system component
MAGKPVFSPHGRHLAAKVQRNGKYTVAVDDRLWSRDCDMAWDPVFSPDGDKLLLRTIDGGTYFRRVMPVADITG